ncbi:Uncharacterised protein [Mycobacteroides abscessus subsp. abscessus]|nr:Uncharacterised protein [Mycobacteroides abscessus subsp. abscessus]
MNLKGSPGSRMRLIGSRHNDRAASAMSAGRSAGRSCSLLPCRAAMLAAAQSTAR